MSMDYRVTHLEQQVSRIDCVNHTTEYKAFAFGVMEGYLKDSADYVDAEESA